MATLDLNILPIHRLNGQDLADLPGLLALTPPRRTARGRERDNLILYLMLTGNATFTAAEVEAFNRKAATAFYQSAGPLTSAMRSAANSLNASLLERNLATTGRGLYALGLLVLAVMRESQVTLLLSGPTHAICLSEGQIRHIHDPALSGKGLGAGQSLQSYFAQVDLHVNDLLVVCGRFPKDWEADLLGERTQASLEASYRRLTITKGDLHAALVQAQPGPGVISILRAEVGAPRGAGTAPAPTNDRRMPASVPEDRPIEPARPAEPEARPDPAPISSGDITEEELDELADFAAHLLQPSAYAIPPQPTAGPPVDLEEGPSSTGLAAAPAQSGGPRNFPPSIPRARPADRVGTAPLPELDEADQAELDELPTAEEWSPVEPAPTRKRSASLLDGLRSLRLSSRPKPASQPTAHAAATRQMAKVMVGGIQSGRRVNEQVGSFLQRFIPRLLPGPESHPGQQQMLFMPTYVLVSIAVLIPVLVSVVGWVVFAKYGLNERYVEFYQKALTTNAQAANETDPTRQRDRLTEVIGLTNQAIEYAETDEAKFLRSEAQAKLDTLMGVVRLEFVPAFGNKLGNVKEINRLAASESDLYMLDAERGGILHATFTGRSLELDTAFTCQPGQYAGYQVDPLVDLLALPKTNGLGATVLGIDDAGQLLYCAPGQVPQAIPLPALPNTNWGRVTAFALDGGSLYVLDATARAVWVFVGKDSTFTDTPYFYFSNQIPETIDSAIDLAVSGDDLYLLHADGHISSCTFSRISETPTRCTDPVNFQDPFPAHQDLNLFAQAHFTQLTLTNPPNSVILLLDAENQKVLRFTPRSLELQNQVTGHAGAGNPFQPGAATAMTVSPNYVLYLAIGNQVYFATNLP